MLPVGGFLLQERDETDGEYYDVEDITMIDDISVLWVVLHTMPNMEASINDSQIDISIDAKVSVSKKSGAQEDVGEANRSNKDASNDARNNDDTNEENAA